MIPGADHGYYALLPSSIFHLQYLGLIAPFPLLGYLSPPVFAIAFNAVVELSLLSRSGTVVFLVFSVSTITVSGFAL